METKVLKIDWQPDKDGNTWLHLLIEDGFLGRKFAAENAERPLRVKLTRWQEKRSLDANAYCFVLIGKIAEATGVPKNEVYREAVRNLGGNYETVCVLKKAANALCEGWSRNGLGWVTEQFPSKIDGCVNVNLYYGSSTYDTKTMSRLIENIVQDAKALDIETLTPAELARLQEDWNGNVERNT
jgi:hypothetical protein